jgi:hypothetical protein
MERFESLTKRQQDEILDKHRHFNTEHLEWWESVYDDFKQDMDKVGIEVHRMYFSGFSSQGDGACFDGRVYSWGDFLPSILRADPALITLAEQAWSFRVEHRGHYYHENCTSFTSDMACPSDYCYSELDEFVHAYSPYKTEIQDAVFLTNLQGYDYDKLHEEFEAEFKSHMRDLYNRLEVEYDALTSDESVMEALNANDMLDEIIDQLEEEYA